MSGLSGAEVFRKLSAEEQIKYVATSQRLTAHVRDRALPIILSPPRSKEGKIEGATGFILRLLVRTFLVTASHVLEGYEKRVRDGETLNWQVGKLPPFDPVARVVWKDRVNDIVVLRISREEVSDVGPCAEIAPTQWPPAVPQIGQIVLVAGYPKKLREDNASGNIGFGPYSAMLRITQVGEDYCKCQIDHRDLVSFCETPVPEPGTNFGGISGGPVLLLDSGYPLVGVATEHCYMESTGLEILQFATLSDMKVRPRQP